METHLGIRIGTFEVQSSIGGLSCEIDFQWINPYNRHNELVSVFVAYDNQRFSYRLYYHRFNVYSNDGNVYPYKDTAYENNNDPFLLFTENNKVLKCCALDELYTISEQSYSCNEKLVSKLDYENYTITANISRYPNLIRSKLIIKKGFEPIKITYDEEELVNSYFLLNERYRIMKMLSFEEIKKQIDSTEKEVESYDIKGILRDLSIEVRESFRHKPGDDDAYSIIETRSVSYPVEKIDYYLKDYLKIGTNVFTERGFCRAESMRRPGLITGIYNEKQVSKIRNELIRNYSKTEHSNAIYKNKSFNLARVIGENPSSVYMILSSRGFYNLCTLKKVHKDKISERLDEISKQISWIKL